LSKQNGRLKKCGASDYKRKILNDVASIMAAKIKYLLLLNLVALPKEGRIR
jgi:hypothetical protein